MMTIDINSIVILNIHGVCYRCVLVRITKSEAINLLRNAELSRKSKSLQYIYIYIYIYNIYIYVYIYI